MAGVIIAVLLGIAGPYGYSVPTSAARQSRHAIRPQVYRAAACVSLVIGLIMSPLVLSAIPAETLNDMTVTGLAGVFAVAWGLTDIARSGQKFVNQGMA